MSVCTAASESCEAAWPNTWVFFWIKVGPATWYFVFLSGATFLPFSFLFWKRHLDCKDVSSCNKGKQRIIYGFFLEYRDEDFLANMGKRRTILPTCQRTRHPFFCFTLLLKCSLICSGPSPLTLQLTVTQFLHHTKQRRGSSAIPAQSLG